MSEGSLKRSSPGSQARQGYRVISPHGIGSRDRASRRRQQYTSPYLKRTRPHVSWLRPFLDRFLPALAGLLQDELKPMANVRRQFRATQRGAQGSECRIIPDALERLGIWPRSEHVSVGNAAGMHSLHQANQVRLRPQPFAPLLPCTHNSLAHPWFGIGSQYARERGIRISLLSFCQKPGAGLSRTHPQRSLITQGPSPAPLLQDMRGASLQSTVGRTTDQILTVACEHL